MKKILSTLLIILVLAFSSSVAFAARPVPTGTGSQKFVPKPVSITPTMVNAALSYTDAQDIRAEIKGLKAEVQSLKKEDKKIWSEIKRLWDAVGQVKAMIKTAISNITAAQARAEEGYKLAKVADTKATDANSKLDKMPELIKTSISEGTKGIREEVESFRFWGLIFFALLTVAIMAVFVYSFFKK